MVIWNRETVIWNLGVVIWNWGTIFESEKFDKRVIAGHFKSGNSDLKSGRVYLKLGTGADTEKFLDGVLSPFAQMLKAPHLIHEALLKLGGTLLQKSFYLFNQKMLS